MADGLRYRIAAGSCALLALTWPASAAEGPPKRGGTLTYLIPADSPPSFDGHREGTFAMVHATAPFYSTLIRINPVNPSSTTDFVCDLCTGMPEPGDGGKTYVFELRNGVKFHDGTPLTAADVKASWDHIISPPEGVLSVRQSYFMMVDSVEAPDPKTVVFRLKFATTVFLPALGDPRNFIYKKTTLEKDPRWYERNIEGSGPFKFVSYETGQSINGVRNADYYHSGLPYLDGFKGIFADKQATRIDALRADRAAIEFRGLPPAARDDLRANLGSRLTVQESDWDCGSFVEANHKKKPFDDVRVRRALTLAIDRWHGIPALSKVADVHTVGGIVLPGAPLAATKDELAANELELTKIQAEVTHLAAAKQEFDRGVHLDSQRGSLQVQQAQSEVAALEVKVRDGHITAPADGTLYSLPVRQGDFVKAGDLLAELADLHQVRVRAFVDEPEIGGLRPNEPVRITWDAMPDRIWQGVTETIPRQVVPRGTRSVGELLCSVNNDKLELLPNVNVNVRINSQERSNVLVIPRGTVASEGGKRYVYVVKAAGLGVGEKVLEKREIQVGIADSVHYEVLSGLDAKDLVALPGDVDLHDGMPAKIINTESAAAEGHTDAQ